MQTHSAEEDVLPQTAQNDRPEEDLRVLLPDNPFVPPEGNTCFINKLPPELLSRVFEIGAADDGSDDEDEDEMEEYWDNFTRRFDAKYMRGNDDHHSDTDMDELRDENESEDEDEDEEGTDDDDDDDATGSTASSSLWPPFEVIVSHVCRHWRNVAFSTPSLWTTIEVGPDMYPPYERVSTLLERSKSLPIDIYIDCDPPEPEVHLHDFSNCGTPSDDDLALLYSLLIPHVYRWRTIEVSVSEYRHMHVFLTAVSDPSISAASQLTTLELHYHDEMEEGDNFAFPDLSKHFTLFGGSAPSLTNVVLWGVHVDWSQSWITSASKLTTLELAFLPEDVRPSWGQFACILRGAPSLERLILSMSGPSGDPSDWITEPTCDSSIELNAPIQLLKVTDFFLGFHSPTRAIGLLRRLYLPSVRNMELDFDNGDYTDFVHALAGPAVSLSSTPAQERSRSLLGRLDSLKIAGLPCRNECVEMLYGQLQNLTALNLSMLYLPPVFLDLLNDPCMPGGNLYLPRLSTLFVSGTSGDILRELVESRRNCGAPLDGLYVEESCEVDDIDAEWLKNNLKTFEFFEGSDDEDVVDFDDLHEDVDDWSDMD